MWVFQIKNIFWKIEKWEKFFQYNIGKNFFEDIWKNE